MCVLGVLLARKNRRRGMTEPERQLSDRLSAEHCMSGNCSWRGCSPSTPARTGGRRGGRKLLSQGPPWDHGRCRTHPVGVLEPIPTMPKVQQRGPSQSTPPSKGGSQPGASIPMKVRVRDRVSHVPVFTFSLLPSSLCNGLLSISMSAPPSSPSQHISLRKGAALRAPLVTFTWRYQFYLTQGSNLPNDKPNYLTQGSNLPNDKPS